MNSKDSKTPISILSHPRLHSDLIGLYYWINVGRTDISKYYIFKYNLEASK